MGKIKNEQIRLGFTMVSFDVKSLFISVPLTEIIVIILDHAKNNMKMLLTLCAKNVHFTLNNEICVQNNAVAMGSPLQPILANVFMIELENTLFSRLYEHVKKWRRFVDDTFDYVLNESINCLNNTQLVST